MTLMTTDGQRVDLPDVHVQAIIAAVHEQVRPGTVLYLKVDRPVNLDPPSLTAVSAAEFERPSSVVREPPAAVADGA